MIQINMSSYLDLTEADATALAKQRGFEIVRITARDGHFFVVTRDARSDRINFRIVEGKVNHANIG